jgi:hypothetical protein
MLLMGGRGGNDGTVWFRLRCGSRGFMDKCFGDNLGPFKVSISRRNFVSPAKYDHVCEI